jgi:pimeloyl-ACP methyl ester carboxylesterase
MFIRNRERSQQAQEICTAHRWQSPTEHRYLTKPLHLCDRGSFYVGGAPKITPYAADADATIGNRQIIIGQMYVQFATPMVSKAWPLIMVHGSGYTGSAVEGTAGGNEGWADYTVRNGIPTYVVDQPGRGRSGFDHTPIHEAVDKLNHDDDSTRRLVDSEGSG